MLKFCSLYSGSTGNSLYVESENSKILIDAGESAKKIESALSSINVNINELDGILVTHEHIDHVKSLGTLSKKYNLPVYSTCQTLDAMPSQIQKISDNNIKKFKINEEFEIKDLKFLPFSIPHDAANPCGFNVFDNNNKISIATDLGHMNNTLIKNLEESIFVMLESNYDLSVLQYSSYPYKLKQRISGPNGHLPNDVAGLTIAHLINSGLKQVTLGHLSKENNFPELAYKTILEKLLENNFDENSININVASRTAPGKLLKIC